jgi:hypothetical protein
MKRAIVGLLMVGMLSVVPAVALEGPAVEYVNGTAQGVKEGSAGRLNTSLGKALEFQAGATGFSIPWDGVQIYKYREENRFRLGVLPAIAVGMLKARSKRHLVTIGWKDADGVAQLVTLETSRDDARGLIAVLRARSPQACKGRGGSSVRWGINGREILRMPFRPSNHKQKSRWCDSRRLFCVCSERFIEWDERI